MKINSKVEKLLKCRICGSKKLYKFLSLGSMPIPNGFLRKELLSKKEDYFPLECFVCEDCHLVQLTQVVNPEIMFKDYVYIPSGAQVMMNNFSNLAYSVHERLPLNEKRLVIDIGSNDGSLLTYFKRFGAQILGIDPAENLALVAKLQGVPTEVELFGKFSAKRVMKKYGQADVITATNVIAHINDLHQVFEGVSLLLKNDGLFVTEFPYLLDLINKNQFDTIYHEHLSYFSVKPWKKLVEQYGFEIVDVQRRLVHGGSIRLTHKRKVSKNESKTVNYLIGLEERFGLYSLEEYDKFAQRIANLKNELREMLFKLKKDKKKIVGYGAAAKGNVLTNYFDIGPEMIKYIVDSTSYKQGLFTPGKHIPVLPEERLLKDMPDYAIVFAWNFADEIIKKQTKFRQLGGKFIIPVPEIKVI